MLNLRCVVETITFQSDETGFAVLRVRNSEDKKSVTVVGTLPQVSVGMSLYCEGDWVRDAKFGKQFKVEHWKEEMPLTLLGLEKYLGSGMIKGVGPSTAKKIVEHFGMDTLDVLENDVDRLLEIPRFGQKRMKEIKESWQKQRDVKEVMIFLQGYGVSPIYAVKIYEEYGSESIAKVKADPYTLAQDIMGIGFKKADLIAQEMGYALNDSRRCESGIIYTLKQLSEEGHVYDEEEHLVTYAHSLLGVSEEEIKQALEVLVKRRKLVREETAVYLPSLYYAEYRVADHLHMLLKDTDKPIALPSMVSIEKKTGVTYDEVQREAIATAVKEKVMVLTGGPGTGKTTTTQGVITVLKAVGLKVLLAAPTGRAAKRMSEATGMEAKTIHRLLRYNPQDGYYYNEENPLVGDALIVDECSMIDVKLMDHLLRALPAAMRLVLVGDIDQLPSVGAGNVLRDIIASGEIPVVRLTRIFRQAQSSRIVMSAHAINRGLLPNLQNGKESDFFFMAQEDAERVVDDIVALVSSRLPKGYGVSSHDIQVLTPMQKGVVGAANLNKRLQEALNPKRVGLKRGDMTFSVGDRVMQIKNNYDKEVFNGDLGYVRELNVQDRELKVDFDNRLVKYEGNDMEELMLAYATTIHKSQGSEYPIVVMPVLMNHYVMLQRNLLYTGITRAKKICVLIGSTKALAYCVQNMTVLERNTLLDERLRNEKIK